MDSSDFYLEFLEENSIISIADKHGKIIHVNDRFCEISKFSCEELIGKDHRIVNSGHHPKSFFAKMWNIIQKGKIWRGEVCNRAKDGSLYWVESFIKPKLDGNGIPIEYYSFRILITDRKNREEQDFYQTVSKLGSIFENSQGFQFFIDKELKLLSFNQAGATIPKIGRGKSVDKGDLDFNVIFKDFKTYLEKSFLGEEIKIEQEVDFFNNGYSRWFLVTYFPVVDRNGKVIGLSLVADDIHKRKESEIELALAYEQKNALIESIPDPIIFKDGEEKWLFINTAARILFQMKGDEWVGKTTVDIISERPEIKKILDPSTYNDEVAWVTGRPVEKSEFVENTKGTIIEYSVKKIPIFYEDGRRKALLVFVQNISEHTRNKAILKKQNEQLDKIAWLQAHKARAPVARILGLADIINLSESNSPLNSEILSKLVENIRELDDVIHKITEYAEEGYLSKRDKNK